MHEQFTGHFQLKQDPTYQAALVTMPIYKVIYMLYLVDLLLNYNDNEWIPKLRATALPFVLHENTGLIMQSLTLAFIVHLNSISSFENQKFLTRIYRRLLLLKLLYKATCDHYPKKHSTSPEKENQPFLHHPMQNPYNTS